MDISIKEINSISEVLFLEEGFRYSDNGHPIEGVFKREPKSKKLVVFLQGAVDRSKLKPPILHRWSWAKDINANVLTLSDPLLYKDNDLRIGWYIGASNFDYIHKFAHFIKNVLVELGLDKRNLIFFSSSAGGYAAIAMATQIKGGLALVNNPQTNVLNYHAGHVSDLLKVGFGGIQKDEIENDQLHRFSLSERMKKLQFIPVIHYYQNIEDKFHYENHFQPFIEEVSSLRLPFDLKVKLYSDADSGHSPMGREESIMIINQAILDKLECVTKK